MHVKFDYNVDRKIRYQCEHCGNYHHTENIFFNHDIDPSQPRDIKVHGDFDRNIFYVIWPNAICKSN